MDSLLLYRLLTQLNFTNNASQNKEMQGRPSIPLKIRTMIFSLLLTIASSLLASSCIENVEVGFSPGGAAKQIVVTAINEATTSIDLAAYSFTSKLIAVALVNAQLRGVNVRIVADKKSNDGKYSAVTYLANHRILVRINDKYAIMHNKFMIIDGCSIETGSFNYTQGAASRNAENVIYLRHIPEITKKYTEEFNRLWSEAVDVKITY